MKVSIFLSAITALAAKVAASNFHFSYPREGTKLTHARDFGVYWSATAGQSLDDNSYDLYFVPVIPDEIEGTMPDYSRASFLDLVPFNISPQHYPGSGLPKKGSYQIWATKRNQPLLRGVALPDGQKTPTFEIVD